MASIEIRKNGETGAAMTPARERLSPFRMMRDLMGWDPFREIVPVWPEQLTAEFAPSFGQSSDWRMRGCYGSSGAKEA